MNTALGEAVGASTLVDSTVVASAVGAPVAGASVVGAPVAGASVVGASAVVEASSVEEAEGSGTSNSDCATQCLECSDTLLLLVKVLSSKLLVGNANTIGTGGDYCLTCACPDGTHARIGIAVDCCLKKGARVTAFGRGRRSEKCPPILSALKLSMLKPDNEVREESE